MSRLEWVISGLLGLVIVVAVASFFVWGTGYNTGSAALGQVSAAESAGNSNLDSHEAYAIALVEARNWADDAQLLTANATWPAGAPFNSGAPSWGFQFYSASQQSTALIAVSNDRARLLRRGPSATALAPLNAEGWLIDSPAVIEILMEHGGQEFMNDHSNTNLTLTLDLLEAFEWHARLIDTSTSASLSMTIDPASGAPGAPISPDGTE